MTIFLGVNIQRMNLGSNGTGIMIGWTLWVFLIPIIIEIFGILTKNKKGYFFLIFETFVIV